MKEDEIDADCLKCESLVSSDEVSDAYKTRLDKNKYYIQSKEHKNILKKLIEKDKEQIKYYT